MPVLGPGIRKIQIDPVNLSRSEYILNILRFHPDKGNVLKLILFQLLNSSQKHAGVFFYAHVIDIWIHSGIVHDKTPFTHTYLNIKRVFVSKVFTPSAGHFFRLVYTKPAVRYHFPRTRYISQSHPLLSCPVCEYPAASQPYSHF